jgi:hypothetical protein
VVAPNATIVEGVEANRDFRNSTMQAGKRKERLVLCPECPPLSKLEVKKKDLAFVKKDTAGMTESTSREYGERT